MKKFLVFLLSFLAAAVIFFCGIFVINGWKDAQNLQARAPLSLVTQQAMSDPDYVGYDQISPTLLEATVCVEDARFYEHGGLDWIGLTRGILSQFIPVFGKSGGSSITQQVVKNLYGRYEAGLEWKGAEMFLALDLEKMYTKDEILALYVNIINYGDNHMGISQAASGYFETTPYDLSPAQATLLAGIPQSPANFQLSDHFPAAKQKQKVVLESMVRNHKLSQEEADAIYAQPISYVAGGYWQQGQ